MRVREKLGDILVSSGLLTQDKLINVLDEQKRSSLKLGQFIISKGILADHEIAISLSDQLGVPRYCSSQFPLDRGMGSVLSYDIAYTNKIVPIKRLDDMLFVAMSNPLDYMIVDMAERLVDCSVTRVVCTECEIENLIHETYGLNQSNVVIDDDSDQCEELEEFSSHSLKELFEGTSAVQITNKIISLGVKEGASDIHLIPTEASLQLKLRIDGKLQSFQSPSREMMLPIISRLKVQSKMDISLNRVPQDGRFSIKVGKREINIRSSVTPTIYGERIVLRLLDVNRKVMNLKEHGMSESNYECLNEMLNKHHGLILSVGPTGAGKTTTLYSLLNNIPRADINVMTVEDPVEYRMNNVSQIQLNDKAGMTFASSLRSILRQDPDVIMIGEIRDDETAVIAARAALTGHLVLSTLHANSAVEAIVRLREMGIDPYILTSVLRVVVGQRLVRTVCSSCAEEYTPSKFELKRWGIDDVSSASFKKGKGCPLCRNTGYKGRTAIFEVLETDDSVKEMIAYGYPTDKITSYVREECNFISLKDAALEKIMSGETTFEEAAGAVIL